MQHPNPRHTWTVAEAKARLSEFLRLADREGPQYIGMRKSFVVIPESSWQPPRQPLGRWLLDNMPRGADLPDRHDRASRRAIPFASEGQG